MNELVVLIDVDHTLLDGDCVRARISEQLDAFGEGPASSRFWAHYEHTRHDLGRVDVPLVSSLVDAELGLKSGTVLTLVQSADYASCVYSGALAVLAHLETLGLTVVLSDGDGHYQRVKIGRSGIAGAVSERVLITTHKEEELGEVERRYPASHYAFLDDRVHILAMIKGSLGERCTTVLVRQGRYANEPMPQGSAPPDIEVTSIRDVASLTRDALLGRPM